MLSIKRYILSHGKRPPKETKAPESKAGTLWHRVLPAGMPGMTPQQPSERQPAPAQRPIFTDCLAGIFGATGIIATGTGQQGRDQQLIAPH